MVAVSSYGRVLKSAVNPLQFWYRATSCLLLTMTFADRNDLMPTQEKLEWVTPKISLMDAGDTDGGKVVFGNSEKTVGNNKYAGIGNS